MSHGYPRGAMEVPNWLGQGPIPAVFLVPGRDSEPWNPVLGRGPGTVERPVQSNNLASRGDTGALAHK